MSTSLDSVPLKYRSNSDYLASLPPWRRLLARLNWHPVRETEIEIWRVRIEKEQLRSETARLRSETARLRSENEQLRKEDALAEKEDALARQEIAREEWLDAQIRARFASDASSSTPAPTRDNSSTPC